MSSNSFEWISISENNLNYVHMAWQNGQNIYQKSPVGLEPTASRLTVPRSNHLSYGDVRLRRCSQCIIFHALHHALLYIEHVKLLSYGHSVLRSNYVVPLLSRPFRIRTLNTPGQGYNSFLVL